VNRDASRAIPQPLGPKRADETKGKRGERENENGPSRAPRRGPSRLAPFKKNCSKNRANDAERRKNDAAPFLRDPFQLNPSTITGAGVAIESKERSAVTMMLDDDPLFAEWSMAEAQPAPRHAAPHSVAPYEVSFEAFDDDEEPVVRVSPERRARLQRYVKMTVAGCVALCVTAAVRVGVSRAMNAENDASAVVAVAASHPSEAEPSLPVSPSPAEAVTPPAADIAPTASASSSLIPLPSASPPAAAPEAVPPALPTTSPVTPPASARPTSPSATAASASPPAAPRANGSAPANAAAPAKSAVQEREIARRALERGKLRDAASAAERATAIDSSDAETWLILGAAKQELGQGAAAQVAFRSCVQSAKHGPINECRAMLR
jgi:hypothetical protein